MKYITVCLSIFMISACKEKNNDLSQKPADSVEVERNEAVKDSLKAQKEIVSVKSQHDKGKEWLENIFKTKGSEKYFPDYDVEVQLCTERFQEFIAESGEIYGPSNLTDEEFPAAEKKYKAKWSKIYPIEEREMWLFGRGNGDIGELEQLKINKVQEGIYSVFIDYGNDMKTQNEVKLVSENGDYKIDYCKIEFLE